MLGIGTRAHGSGSISQVLAETPVQLEFAGQTGHFLLHRIDTSPCHAACPAGVDVKGYVGLVAQKKFQEAVDLVRRDCPLPGICGRVCNHPCEIACHRADQDDAIAIRLLKRFVADWELAHPRPGLRQPPRRYEEKVAVVGAGPAGLAAAYDLIQAGYGVTLFEAGEEAGGMLTQCIPAFRLPREIIRSEVGRIQALGVELQTGVMVGRDVGLEELREQGYASIILAIGAQNGKRLGLPGEAENGNIFDCVDFLRKANRGEPLPMGKRLIVVGGGMSAMDAARTAKRLGFPEVEVVYRRTRNEMPATTEEVDEAEREGVILTFLAAPLEILGRDGQVTGMLCNRMKLEQADESGRPRPVPIEGDTFTVEADVIVPAISQVADLSLLPESMNFAITKWGTIGADNDNLSTGVEGVFAAGDAVVGPDTVIGAIAQGHRAARSAMAHMRGLPLPKREKVGPSEIGILPRQPKSQRRIPAAELETAARKGFDEVELGYAIELAVEESQRCLRCGPCDECTACGSDCRHRLVMLAPETGNGHGPADPEREPVLLRVPTDPDDFPLQFEPREVVLKWPSKVEGKKVHREEEFLLKPLHCEVDMRLCRGCGDCIEACAYDAIRLVEKPGQPTVAKVFPEFCRSCGNCVPPCPTQAMIPGYFEHEAMLKEIETLMTAPEGDAPRILFFSCNWCVPLGPHVESWLPEGVAHIGALCTGRIHPSFVTKAFEVGADAVFVAGCAEGECHYEKGNSSFLARMAQLRLLLGLLGVPAERCEVALVPSGDLPGLQNALGDFVGTMKERGPLNLITYPQVAVPEGVGS